MEIKIQSDFLNAQKRTCSKNTTEVKIFLVSEKGVRNSPRSTYNEKHNFMARST